MRYTRGDVFNSTDAPDEIDWEVAEAIVTDERVAIDWTEDEDQYVLVAHSTDGTEYKGTYGIDRGRPLVGPWRADPTHAIGEGRKPGRLGSTTTQDTQHFGSQLLLAVCPHRVAFRS